MCHTTARETYKTRMQIGQSLCQIGSQSIFTPLKSLLREQRNHIQMQFSRHFRFHRKHSRIHISLSRQHSRLLFPFSGCYPHRRFRHFLSLIIQQTYDYCSTFASFRHTREDRKIILFSFFQRNSIETRIAESDSRLGLQYDIMRIVLMQRIFSCHLYG